MIRNPIEHRLGLKGLICAIQGNYKMGDSRAQYDLSSLRIKPPIKFKQKFQLSDSSLSIVLLAAAVGAILSMPLAGQVA